MTKADNDINQTDGLNCGCIDTAIIRIYEQENRKKTCLEIEVVPKSNTLIWNVAYDHFPGKKKAHTIEMFESSRAQELLILKQLAARNGYKLTKIEKK